MTGCFLLVLSLAALATARHPYVLPPAPSGYAYPWQDPSVPLETRLTNLLSLMNYTEKIDNMQMASPGAMRIGLHPYHWGHECERGDVSSTMGTCFPQSMGLAASFNTSLLHSVGRATADEVRANFNTLTQSSNYDVGANCWSPMINVNRDPRWGRSQEGYGEDPHYSAALTFAYVRGLQDSPADANHFETIASCKHYDAYAGPENDQSGPGYNQHGPGGRFGFEVKVLERDWRETYLPAWESCVAAGAQGIMCSYNSMTLTDNPSLSNNVPSCYNPLVLNTVLRDLWNFTGYVTSDCGAINFGMTQHHYRNNSIDAAVTALTAGCDLECDCCSTGPLFPSLKQAYEAKLITMADLDKALGRALRTRLLLGVLDPFGTNPLDALTRDNTVDSPQHRALALNAALQTFVLLKNDNAFLPLTPPNPKFATLCVFGPTANDTDAMRGDYAPVPPFMITSLMGIQSRALASGYTAVKYLAGCNSTACTDLDPNLATFAQQCGVSVVVLGLRAISRGTPNGSSVCVTGGNAIESEGCDRLNVDFPGQQQQLLETVHTSGTGKTVLVMINGGMLAANWVDDNIDAILHATYPGEYAGTALASVLFGDYNPASRLVNTWYSDFATVPGMDNYTMANRTYRYHAGPHLFPFGHGLSYTTFEYSKLSMASDITVCDTLTLSVNLMNTGLIDGDEVAQLYLSQPNSTVRVPLRQLVAFSRVHIKAGASLVVLFSVTPRQMSVMRDGDFTEVVEPGTRVLSVGGGQPFQRPGKQMPVVVKTFEVKGPTTVTRLCPFEKSGPMMHVEV